ncbi:hypothetical protein KY349_01325 [Candidatus Woesearchaeota archaeon]|nr:hypothetical protein [Candidatus Woesearchaeota archaeon]
MEIRFPCGAKGRPEFCPDLCNYGEFCKIKEKKEDEKPRGLQEEEPVEEIRDEDVSDVEFYY